ncbi:AAA family ATPase [Streptomyces sp. NPDC001046]|uniref:helix-turn-helix transcriptional regulator n=1 Tax=Streptomyces sp. NPDC001046 TaxID=3364543 RepID=UPI0036AE4FD0
MTAQSGMVGRGDELRRLLDIAERARRQEAQVVFLSGPAGIGKTSLTAALCRELPDFRILSVAGVPTERLIKYAALNRMIKNARGGLPRDRRRVNLVPETSSVMAAGGALIDVLDDVRGDSPTALVIEDAHWADAGSLQAIGFAVLRMTHDHLLCLVVTEQVRRTKGDMGLTASIGGVSQLDLGGLSPQAVREFLAAHGFRAVPESQLLRISRWSDGNPLYLKALLAASEGSLPGRPSVAEVPPSLAEAVREWSRSLPPAGRLLLDVLAVLDAPATVPLLRRMTGDENLLQHIDDLVAEGAVTWRDEAGEPSLHLIHAGQRDALYSSLPLPERTRLHRAAAENVDPPGRWRHRVAALASYDAELAAELGRAAERESADGDLSLAAQYLLAVSAVSPDPDTRDAALLQAVRLLVVSGQYAPALAYADRVEAHPASPRKQEALGFLEYARGRDVSAAEHLRLARDGFAGVDEEAAARASGDLATLQRSLGLGEQSARSARYALARTSDPAVIGEAQANLAYGAALSHGPAEGLRLLTHLRQNPADVAPADLDALVCRGTLAGLSGQLVQALSDLRAMARTSAPGLTRRTDFAARVHAASCHFQLGEWEEARRTVSLAFDEAQVSGRDVDFAVLHTMSSTLHASRGRWEAAAADLTAAEEIARTTDFSAPGFHVLQAGAFGAFVRQDWQGVMTRLRRAQDDAANAGRVRLYGTWFLPLLGVACARAGQLRGAEEALTALEEIEPTGAMPVVARRWLLGTILHARGETGAAVRAYRDGLAEPPDGGEPLVHRCLLRCDLGRALTELGEPDEADRHVGAAERAFRALQARPWLEQCRALRDESAGPGRVADAERFWSELTDREKDTARLVARGWTNREIAGELYLSTKTVEYYLGKMYAKGELRNRRQLRDLVQALTA